ncbi:hypothetical protein AX16_006738 [Volvariella volvacea WC 439]|nr:hypothetical protein AX16_006738 [Volvariella volvacea WC 439]
MDNVVCHTWFLKTYKCPSSLPPCCSSKAMTLTSVPPKPSRNLSQQQVQQLRSRAEEVLQYLVETNSNTIYFRESDHLSKLRTNLAAPHKSRKGARLLTTYASSVEFSTYDTYLPFIQRFVPTSSETGHSVVHRDESELSNVFAPGLPTFVAISSGTSGKGPKYFPKYEHPATMSQATSSVIHDSNPKPLHEGGSNCVMFDLKYRQLIQVGGDEQEGQRRRRIPISQMSSGTFRRHSGWADVNGDSELLHIKREHNSSPLAVSFIKSYKCQLLMHALFALADRGLEMINSLFSTLLFDFVKYIIEHWEVLVDAIETGIIPDFDGIEPANLKPYLQAHLKPSPERAAELCQLGRYKDQKGWLKLLWPNLRQVIANSSGTFESVVPMVRNYLGDEVLLHSLTYGSSEAFIGHIYDPKNHLNLYKVVGSDEFIEYLPLEKEKARIRQDGHQELTVKDLKRPWELQSGKVYELVLTTRDGFWRYRLEDLVKIEGFDPTDGQPIISYQGRRNCFMQTYAEKISERELRMAVDAVKKVLGEVTEFAFIADGRSQPRSYGLLVELAPSSAASTRASSHDAIEVLDKQLKQDVDYLRQRDGGVIGQPTIRVLSTGTFKAFRDWKIEMNIIGSGQIKVPTVVHDPKTTSWFLERVIGEIVSAPKVQPPPLCDLNRMSGQNRGINSE